MVEPCTKVMAHAASCIETLINRFGEYNYVTYASIHS